MQARGRQPRRRRAVWRSPHAQVRLPGEQVTNVTFGPGPGQAKYVNNFSFWDDLGGDSM
jgi:hypothetical protein